MTTTKTDEKAIRSIAAQDQGGETDDSYARTDALDTIRRWRSAAAEAGDTELCETIDRLGEREAARIYEAARESR